MALIWATAMLNSKKWWKSNSIEWRRLSWCTDKKKSFSDRERKNVTDFRFRRISLASSLTVGPNMDRKLNKNWDDVSTETVETACSYENLYTLAKEEKEIRFQNFLHNDHFWTTLQNWADLLACNGRCPNWQTTKVLMDLNFCQFTTFQWAGHKLC